MSTPLNTRRWPRHQVVLPVRIVALNRHLTPPTLARASEISRAGMALHARIAVRPGDLMQLQVPTSPPIDITAVVRNRTGDCLGLEFLPQLPFVNEGREESKLRRSSAAGGSPELRQAGLASCNPQTVYAALRRKQQELRHVQMEIEALNIAILLLAEDEDELSKAVNTVAASYSQKSVVVISGRELSANPSRASKAQIAP